MMKNNIKQLIILILAILITSAGCSPKDRQSKSDNAAAAEQKKAENKIRDTQKPEANTTGALNIESAEPKDAVDKITDIREEKPVQADGAVKEIQGLVMLKQVDGTIIYDLKYATSGNFTKKIVYPFNTAVLRKETAEKLKKVNDSLKKKGYRIKVWDAYRPVAVQKIFWDLVKDERYVANPAKGGSNHNRGTAVDVTLVDGAGKEVEMPSEFDDFTVKASRDNQDMKAEVKKNLELLTKAMTENGFRAINSEWWHYDDIDSKNYPVLDVDIKSFENDKVTVVRQKPVEKMPEIKKSSAPETKNDSNISFIEGTKTLGDCSQVVLVAADSFEASAAKLSTYEKADGKWQEVLAPVKAMAGRNGFTYSKKEGDGKSPIGVFSLERCFGRADNPGTKLKYVTFEKDDFWVDDSRSNLYNTFQKGVSNGRWSSAEDLYRIGGIYKFFIVIEYNTKKIVPGKGSAIFLHIWEGDGIDTSGCISVSESSLLKIIKWLDPAKKPKIIQGPAGELGKL